MGRHGGSRRPGPVGREARGDDARGPGRSDSIEEHPDGEWVVRPVTGHAAVKDYRCPGCDQLIGTGVPHVVAWPHDSLRGPDDRRHWHSACWGARDRRRGRPDRRRRPGA